MAGKTTRLKIWRQEAHDKPGRFEEFELPHRPGANIISCLMEIQKHPTTAKGEKTTPPVWESNCLEEVCGACTMVINGKVQQSCSALVDRLAPNGETITLEPMHSFPLVRDLMVDRSKMFDTLKKVHAWIDLDGTHDLGPGPRLSPYDQEWAYELSKCMTCGCCLEACPNWHYTGEFVGPAAISQVRLFNTHPSGQLHAHVRLESLMGPGGITDCGNAQNCVKVCPKGIPLTTSIADMYRETTKYSISRWFRK